MAYSEDVERRIKAGMRCGSEHIPGWKPIIEQLNADIANLDPGYVIDQVKQKFGGLRYYVSWSPDVEDWIPDAIDKLVDDAEERSFKVCERCSAPGETGPRPGGYWLFTLCEACRNG